jgi:plastocyanin
MKHRVGTLLKALGLCIGLLPGPATLAADSGTAQAPVTATLDADGVQRATLILDNYSYTPSHLVVAAGKPVELTLASESGFAPHNLVIDDPASDLSIRQDVGSGKTVQLAFTPTRAGRFVFYCDKKAPFMASHRKKGMEGVLEVR